MSSSTLLIVLLSLVILLYLKWIIIALVFPFQCIYGQVKRRWLRPLMPLWAKALAAPYWLWEKLFRGGWSRFMLFEVSTLPSCHLRKLIYRMLGAQVGERVVFHFRTEIRDIYRLRVGRGSVVGDNALLDARNGIVMGDNVNLSSNVSIYTEQHDYRDPLFGCDDKKKKKVVVGDRVWIGSNVVVLPGVEIGEGAVLCAGCVVTKDVRPFAVVAGIPASEIGERPRDLSYELDGRSCRLF